MGFGSRCAPPLGEDPGISTIASYTAAAALHTARERRNLGVSQVGPVRVVVPGPIRTRGLKVAVNELFRCIPGRERT